LKKINCSLVGPIRWWWCFEHENQDQIPLALAIVIIITRQGIITVCFVGRDPGMECSYLLRKRPELLLFAPSYHVRYFLCMIFSFITRFFITMHWELLKLTIGLPCVNIVMKYHIACLFPQFSVKFLIFCHVKMISLFSCGFKCFWDFQILFQG